MASRETGEKAIASPSLSLSLSSFSLFYPSLSLLYFSLFLSLSLFFLSLSFAPPLYTGPPLGLTVTKRG